MKKQPDTDVEKADQRRSGTGQHMGDGHHGQHRCGVPRRRPQQRLSVAVHDAERRGEHPAAGHVRRSKPDIRHAEQSQTEIAPQQQTHHRRHDTLHAPEEPRRTLGVCRPHACQMVRTGQKQGCGQQRRCPQQGAQEGQENGSPAHMQPVAAHAGALGHTQPHRPAAPHGQGQGNGVPHSLHQPPDQHGFREQCAGRAFQQTQQEHRCCALRQPEQQLQQHQPPEIPPQPAVPVMLQLL